MTDESNNDKPRSKLSSLLSSGEEKKPVKEKTSPLTRLPKKADVLSFLPEQGYAKATPPLETALPSDIPTGTVKTPSKKIDQTPPKPDPVINEPRYNFGPPFWTITGALSLAVNLVLIIVLALLLTNARNLPVGGLMNIGNSLLGGLYSNFELMDRAHITTTIPVETTIPVKFDLQLNQSTNVVLSQDVTIDGALVTVQTGGLNITRARTTIVLPQGTNLPIVLNLTVPVDTTVPVTLQVPVDIALSETDLHQPFVGLQNVLQPYYCLINKSAVNMDGAPICE